MERLDQLRLYIGAAGTNNLQVVGVAILILGFTMTCPPSRSLGHPEVLQAAYKQ